MWRLHTVHHSDKNVDVTTGTRHHPFDFIIQETFALIAVVIMGMPIAFIYFINFKCAFTYFTRQYFASKAIGQSAELHYRYSNMHKFHHHFQMPWTDSNFGNMLSIWDRLFGTFVYSNTSEIKYGLDIADHRDDENILQQLRLPFDKSIHYKK